MCQGRIDGLWDMYYNTVSASFRRRENRMHTREAVDFLAFATIRRFMFILLVLYQRSNS